MIGPSICFAAEERRRTLVPAVNRVGTLPSFKLLERLNRGSKGQIASAGLINEA
jgi:hypothetical protein